MMRNGKTEEAIGEAVALARNGRHVRIITTKQRAKTLHALLAKHEGGSINGDTWEFGDGSVEVVT